MKADEALWAPSGRGRLHAQSWMEAINGLSSQGSPGEVLKDPRVQCWIENYRNLLDAWRFWHKRAEFDILRGKLDPSSKPLAQVIHYYGMDSSFSS